MKRFNVIASTARSGSTLLCNVLNQNPEFYASDTSAVSLAVAQAAAAFTNRPEFRSELHADADGVSHRLASASRNLVLGWYGHQGGKVVFDKDRSNGWLYQFDSFARMFPRGKMFVLVRHPCDIFASVLKHTTADPLMQPGVVLNGRTLPDREAGMMGPKGLVGNAIRAIEDINVREELGEHKTDHVLFLRYEDLVSRPLEALELMYKAMGLAPYAHQFEDVKSVAKDLDALYFNQWPHEGGGRVAPRPSDWKAIVPQALGARILQRYPIFCQYFGYQ